MSSQKQVYKNLQTNENDLHHHQNRVEDPGVLLHDVRKGIYVHSSSRNRSGLSMMTLILRHWLYLKFCPLNHGPMSSRVKNLVLDRGVKTKLPVLYSVGCSRTTDYFNLYFQLLSLILRKLSLVKVNYKSKKSRRFFI